MPETHYQFQPDYAAAPGAVLAERLAVWGMSQAEFARRCGRSPSLIRRIIAGTAPVTPETARQRAAALRHYGWPSAAALQLLGFPFPDK